ncbi:hypothetical protein K1X84_15055 [bacterium]|nr:hypothetical protein [bacterium]
MKDQHCNEDELIDYVLRNEFQLPENQSKAIEAHLHDCADCRTVYDRLTERYKQVHAMKPAKEHFEELSGRSTTGRTRFVRPYQIAAVILILVLPYGLSVWMMNRSFDRGPIGLEAFQMDYKFASSPESYRGDQSAGNEDVRLFKKGVVAIFGAKKSTMGLFPHYDLDQIKVAENYFNGAKNISRNPDVLYKVEAYLKKIELIRAAAEE